LLGQAESGKSTLQKQFQLLHSPASLDAERASWKIVIFYNVVHAIRTILNGLEQWGHLVYQNLNQPRSNSSEEGDPYTPGGRPSITQLRLRLTALVAIEQVLADRLSGGLKITGGGKNGVYVRSGWQVMTQAHLARSKGKGKARSTGNTPDDTDPDELIADVARRLEIAREDIAFLRSHPAVTKLLEKKKIVLEEWSELYVHY
jgi:guanine nucleotide-binding protein alpha-1 subunit